MVHRLSPEAEVDLDELWYYVASNASVEIADRLVGFSDLCMAGTTRAIAAFSA